jgi:LysR family transcriptional regulator, benzoate and cis,cis-muconate-responsive activator of ben and cat genes
MPPSYRSGRLCAVETRELRYFVTVAEELHFGRAARRLDIAQPALTRTIQKMERILNTPLFIRSGRSVALTAAGKVLLEEGKKALDAVDFAERRARRAGQPGLVLVAVAGLFNDLVTELLDCYSASPDAAPVDVVLARCGPGEAERMLRDGQADVGLLHLPPESLIDLVYKELTPEGKVALLPSRHPLATRDSLRMADVADIPGLPLPRWPRPDGTYPDGPGPAFRDGTQLLQLIGMGRACAVMPESIRQQLPPEVAAIPLIDASMVTRQLVWPSHSQSHAVGALARAAAGL